MSRFNSKTKDKDKLSNDLLYYEQWYVNRQSGNASVQTLTLRKIVYMQVTDLELVFVQGEGVVAQEEVCVLLCVTEELFHL